MVCLASIHCITIQHGEAMSDERAFPNDNYQPGMTLRDYFAAHALATFASNSAGFLQIGRAAEPDVAAKYAYACAEAMLRERAALNDGKETK